MIEIYNPTKVQTYKAQALTCVVFPENYRLDGYNYAAGVAGNCATTFYLFAAKSMVGDLEFWFGLRIRITLGK